jgi:hypothetical protein
MWDERRFNDVFYLDGDLTRRIKLSKAKKDKRKFG